LRDALPFYAGTPVFEPSLCNPLCMAQKIVISGKPSAVKERTFAPRRMKFRHFPSGGLSLLCLATGSLARLMWRPDAANDLGTLAMIKTAIQLQI
jgi:hypothetical protein